MNTLDAQWRAARSSGLGVTIYAVAGSETYERVEARSNGQTDEPVATCLDDRVAEHIVALHNMMIERVTRGYR
jgi:hypothetical protein